MRRPFVVRVGRLVVDTYEVWADSADEAKAHYGEGAVVDTEDGSPWFGSVREGRYNRRRDQ